MTKVGAIIVSYNSGKTLVACIESLNREHISSIVVVDNNSQDASRDIAASQSVQVIKNNQNIGFAAAANQGAIKIAEPYLLFINPDATLEKGALSYVVAYLENNPQVAMCGLVLKDPHSQQIEAHSFGAFPTLWGLIQRKVTQQKLTGKDPQRIDWVSGGAFIIRRTVWEKIGGFDTEFFMYWEDVDLCYRLYKAGYQIALVPQAVCFHSRGASLTDSVAKARLYDSGADRYFRKHYPNIIWKIQVYMRRFYRALRPHAQ